MPIVNEQPINLVIDRLVESVEALIDCVMDEDEKGLLLCERLTNEHRIALLAILDNDEHWDDT